MAVAPEKDDPAELPDDARLFREAVRGVRPLGAPTPASTGPKKVRPRARFTRADRAAVLRESLEAASADPASAAGDELVFHQPHIHARIVRRLRRGEYRVQREIDLHGMSVPQAKHALREFLLEALEEQVRCVRIIHGKGLRSGHRGPVLKGVVSVLLRNTGAVLAYVSARPVDGGTGALYVLLQGR